MPRSQKAVILKAFNPQEPHRAAELSTSATVPEPGEGEVLVRVTGRPIEPADVLILQGFYPAVNQLPTVAGADGAGFVEKLGPNAGKRVQVGTRVVGIPINFEQQNGGSWQEYTVMSEDNVAEIPKSWDEQTACQTWGNPMTARGIFDTLDVPAGGFLLQSASGSVLGRLIIQMAQHYSIKTINVVRRNEQKAELIGIGADEVLVWNAQTGENIAERVRDITGGKGAYAAIDAVGGELTQKLVEAVRPRGQTLIYGAMSGLTFTAGIPDVLFHLKVITGFHLLHWKDTIGHEKFWQCMNEVIHLLDKGVLQPFTGKTFPLEQFAEAVLETIKPARGGKVCLIG